MIALAVLVGCSERGEPTGVAASELVSNVVPFTCTPGTPAGSFGASGGVVAWVDPGSGARWFTRIDDTGLTLDSPPVSLGSLTGQLPALGVAALPLPGGAHAIFVADASYFGQGALGYRVVAADGSLSPWIQACHPGSPWAAPDCGILGKGHDGTGGYVLHRTSYSAGADPAKTMRGFSIVYVTPTGGTAAYSQPGLYVSMGNFGDAYDAVALAFGCGPLGCMVRERTPQMGEAVVLVQGTAHSIVKPGPTTMTSFVGTASGFYGLRVQGGVLQATRFDAAGAGDGVTYSDLWNVGTIDGLWSVSDGVDARIVWTSGGTISWAVLHDDGTTTAPETQPNPLTNVGDISYVGNDTVLYVSTRAGAPSGILLAAAPVAAPDMCPADPVVTSSSSSSSSSSNASSSSSVASTSAASSSTSGAGGASSSSSTSGAGGASSSSSSASGAGGASSSAASGTGGDGSASSTTTASSASSSAADTTATSGAGVGGGTGIGLSGGCSTADGEGNASSTPAWLAIGLVFARAARRRAARDPRAQPPLAPARPSRLRPRT
ncbi:MAG: hypothetical protein U0414_12360 [Polyangiaceae bacterium]